MRRGKLFLSLVMMGLSACSPTKLNPQTSETQAVENVATATQEATPKRKWE